MTDYDSTCKPIQAAAPPLCSIHLSPAASSTAAAAAGVWITAVAHVNSINDVPKITDSSVPFAPLRACVKAAGSPSLPVL